MPVMHSRFFFSRTIQMSLRDEFEEEPETRNYWRFPDCGGCKNRFKPRLCGDCGSGEHYEELDPDGLDKLFL